MHSNNDIIEYVLHCLDMSLGQTRCPSPFLLIVGVYHVSISLFSLYVGVTATPETCVDQASIGLLFLFSFVKYGFKAYDGLFGSRNHALVGMDATLAAGGLADSFATRAFASCAHGHGPATHLCSHCA